MGVMIKTKSMPAHVRIREHLLGRIRSGSLKVGACLTEERLTRTYGVSRPTLKKALTYLKAEGLVNQIPGRGTFVTSPDDPVLAGMKEKFGKQLNRGIGVLMPCVSSRLHSGVMRGVEDAAAESGYYITVGSYDAQPERERAYIESFVGRGLSGLIIAPSFNSCSNPWYQTMKERGIPFVLTDVPVRTVDADLVQTDNRKAAYLGTKILLDAGCRRIAFLCRTRTDSSNSQERIGGYTDALREAGIPVDTNLIREGEPVGDFGYQASREILLRNDVDGFFSANEPIVFGILQALREQNRSVPDQIKVVAFDEPALPPEMKIALIKQPQYAIGRAAARLLLDRIRERRAGQATPVRKILLDPELIQPERYELASTVT